MECFIANTAHISFGTNCNWSFSVKFINGNISRLKTVTTWTTIHLTVSWILIQKKCRNQIIHSLICQFLVLIWVGDGVAAGNPTMPSSSSCWGASWAVPSQMRNLSSMFWVCFSLLTVKYAQNYLPMRSPGSILIKSVVICYVTQFCNQFQ